MKGKKAFGGDGFAIILIVILLASVAFTVPLVASAINSDAQVANIDKIEDNVRDSSESISILNAGQVLISIFTFALFGWGDALGLPSALALFFTLLAVSLFILGFRTIRGVG